MYYYSVRQICNVNSKHKGIIGVGSAAVCPEINGRIEINKECSFTCCIRDEGVFERR